MNIDLASLTAEEKRSLYDSLAFDLRGTSATRPDERMTALWNDINDALKLPRDARRSLTSFLEVAGMRSKINQGVEFLDGLLIQALPARSPRTVRIQVRELMISCLIDYLRLRGVPATPTTLVNNLDKLRAAVDDSFPGYIQAQLLHRIVGAHVAA